MDLVTQGLTTVRRNDRTASTTARLWALVATALGFGVVQLDVTVVDVAIRPIGAALGGSVSGLQWIVNAYTSPWPR